MTDDTADRRRGAAVSVADTPPSLGDTMVLFDWNGTVVVDADRAMAALNAVLARRGLPMLGEAEFSVRFRLPLSELFGRLGVAAVELPAAEHEWSEALETSRAHLREGAADCLAELDRAGAWLGVVSAASPAAVRFDQRSLAVPSVWKSVDAAVSDKYPLLVRHRAIRPVAYFVGDSADDMRCASAAGYTPVGVTDAHIDPKTLRSAGAVHVIGSLGELLAIVA
jgi:phosphoglycolate phosphatase